MATQSNQRKAPGVPLWLPLAGVVIALLVFGLVVIKSANLRGKVSVSAPAGANPAPHFDEGDQVRAALMKNRK